MNTTLSEKHIYGTSIRTNNQQSEMIKNLWEQFLQLNLKGDIYAIYHNYASDFTGDYDLHIGLEEKSGNEEVIIPIGNYYVIEVDSTDPNGVINAWINIWNSDIKRAYNTDFELYASDGTIKIFLSV